MNDIWFETTIYCCNKVSKITAVGIQLYWTVNWFGAKTCLRYKIMTDLRKIRLCSGTSVSEQEGCFWNSSGENSADLPSLLGVMSPSVSFAWPSQHPSETEQGLPLHSKESWGWRQHFQRRFQCSARTQFVRIFVLPQAKYDSHWVDRDFLFKKWIQRHASPTPLPPISMKNRVNAFGY